MQCNGGLLGLPPCSGATAPTPPLNHSSAPTHLQELHFALHVAPLLALLGQSLVDLLGTVQLQLLVRLEEQNLGKGRGGRAASQGGKEGGHKRGSSTWVRGEGSGTLEAMGVGL